MKKYVVEYIHTYIRTFFFFQTFRHQIIKKHMQRPFKGNCACVRAFERARSLITIFFLSFLLSLFLLCAICKLRNCRRSKMCHSSSWFFAAALSSSLSLSLILSLRYLFILFAQHLLRARVYVMRAICGNIVRTFLAFSISFFFNV